MKTRQSSLEYLDIVSDALQIPMDSLLSAWRSGEDVVIPTSTELGVNGLYPSHGIFIHSGILRDYFIDNKGIEHTIRFPHKTSVISPGLNDLKVNSSGIEILTETLTEVEAKIWDFNFMREQAEQNPLLFRPIIAVMCEAMYIKQRNDVRFSACTAKQRYLLFLESFPGVVNQVPLKYISSYLKMTPETISRVRTEISK